MRGAGRRGTDRALNDRGNLIIVDRARSTGTVFIQKSLDAVFQKAASPFANRMFVDAKLGSNRTHLPRSQMRIASSLRAASAFCGNTHLAKVADLTREHGISDATIYNWKAEAKPNARWSLV